MMNEDSRAMKKRKRTVRRRPELRDFDKVGLLRTAGVLANVLDEVAHAAWTALEDARGHADVLVEGGELLGVAAGLGHAVRGDHVRAVLGEDLLTAHVQLLGRAVVRAVFHVTVQVLVALAEPDAVAFLRGLRHLQRSA